MTTPQIKAGVSPCKSNCQNGLNIERSLTGDVHVTMIKQGVQHTLWFEEQELEKIPQLLNTPRPGDPYDGGTVIRVEDGEALVEHENGERLWTTIDTTPERPFRIGDKVRKKDGTDFSNGKKVVTIESFERFSWTSSPSAWLKETNSHLETTKLVHAD